MNRTQTLSGYAWAVVALLWPVAMLNYLDRQMVSTIRAAIRADIPSIANDQEFATLMAVFMWVYAALIMFSRVAVLAHHPSDVIASALVALVGTHLLRRWFAARRLVFRASDLRSKPAPSVARIKAALRQAISSRNLAA